MHVRTTMSTIAHLCTNGPCLTQSSTLCVRSGRGPMMAKEL